MYVYIYMYMERERERRPSSLVYSSLVSRKSPGPGAYRDKKGRPTNTTQPLDLRVEYVR